MIFFSIQHQAGHSDDQRQNFRRNTGHPDAGQSQQKRQNQDDRHLKYQRPEEGNQSGKQPVVQRREEGGAEDIDAADQKRHGADAKTAAGHSEQRFVVTDENGSKRYCQKLCHGN